MLRLKHLHKDHAEHGEECDKARADQGGVADLAQEERSSSTGRRAWRRGARGHGGDAAASWGGGTSGLTARVGAARLAALALKTWTRSRAVLEVGLSSLWHIWKLLTIEVLDLPGAALGWAFAWLAVGLVAAIARRVGSLQSSHQSLEVRGLLDRVAVDLDKTVAAALLGVLVDKTARVDGSHLVAVERRHFLKLTLIGNAAIFRQAGASQSSPVE